MRLTASLTLLSICRLARRANIDALVGFFWEWDWGSTALHKAVDTEDVELISYLLEKGADTTIGDARWDETSYDWAGYYENDAVREVLKAASNTEEENSSE